MRRPAALAALVLATLAAPHVASADRLRLGVSLGRADGDSSVSDAGRSRGLFGQLRLVDRLAVQVELSRTEPDGWANDALRLGAAALVDLTARRRLTPFALVGGAVERTASGWGDNADFRAREVGLGLDYRVADRLVVSLDGRLGERTQTSEMLPVDVCIDRCAPGLAAGEYTSLRVGLGVAF